MSSRVTFAIYLDLSLDLLLPGFFDRLAEIQFFDGLDRGGFRYRLECGRVEIGEISQADFGLAREALERAGLEIVKSMAARLGIPDNWPELGRLTVLRVADDPQPKYTPGAGENPAIRCPECGEPMLPRAGRNGSFFGCRNYPSCRGTRPIRE